MTTLKWSNAKTLADLDYATTDKPGRRHIHHWTTGNDETLCGRIVRKYLYGDEHLELAYPGDGTVSKVRMCSTCSRSLILARCYEGSKAEAARVRTPEELETEARRDEEYAAAIAYMNAHDADGNPREPS